MKRRLTYQTLSQAAHNRLETTIAAIITDNEQRFIEWYNNAQPVGLRKHQLDVLPEVGNNAAKRSSMSAGRAVLGFRGSRSAS